jgi:hypothetical protein
MGRKPTIKNILISHSQLFPSTRKNLYTPFTSFSLCTKNEVTLPIKRDLFLNTLPSTEFSGPTTTTTTISLFLLKKEVKIK